MADQRFAEGTIVYLRAGSPAMVCEMIRDDGIVPVAWFNGAVLCRDAFHQNALITQEAWTATVAKLMGERAGSDDGILDLIRKSSS